MSDRLERESLMIKGRASERFVDDPLFKQAVDTMETELFVRWRNTQPDQRAEREEIWSQWHALDEVQKALQRPIADGTLAQAEQEQDNYQSRLG